MPLAANTKLGPYEIAALLGAGGMGEVYRARDIRHDRMVAVKVLSQKAPLPGGAERFFREIRIAAQLTHPHILPLIDSGESDGVLFFAPYAVDRTVVAHGNISTMQIKIPKIIPERPCLLRFVTAFGCAPTAPVRKIKAPLVCA